MKEMPQEDVKNSKNTIFIGGGLQCDYSPSL